ncbi:MAG: HWE histidine kinase domain-containing protein [Janthinobacterium lividum]
MTTNPGVAVTASGNDNTLPVHLLFPEPQVDLPISSTKELLVRVAGLWDNTRFLTVGSKSAVKRARFQLSEVEHRLMNTFSTMQAAAARTASPGNMGEAFRADFGPRLLALARSNEFLGSQYPEGAPLDLIITRCLEPFEDKPNRITKIGPRVFLRARDVLPIGLALHELTTNAAKHGALSVPEGRVEVMWSLEARRTDRGRSVVITWRERGGPPVMPPNRRGFGSRLLERGLAQSSGSGTAQLDFAPNGVECRIWLPISNARNRIET